jgi:hypothetical protein
MEMAESKSAISHAATRYDGVVRVTLPASVAFDMDRFGKVLAGIADRLGHRSCLSGAACLFMIERNFVVDPQLGIQGVALSDPMPSLPAVGFEVRG